MINQLIRLAIFMILLSGCTAFVIPKDNEFIKGPRAPFPTPEFFNAPRTMPRIGFSEETQEEKYMAQNFYFLYRDDTPADRIEGYFYYPDKPRSKDVFLVLPGMGEDASAKGLAEKLAYYGFNVVRIKSGFKGLDEKDFEEALKKSDGEAVIEELASQYRARMRGRIIDLMRLNDFLEKEYGMSRIHLIGVSIGGVVGNLLMAVDPRVESHMMILSAANVARIVMDSQAPKKIAPIKDYREKLLGQYKLTYDEAYKLLEEKLAPANPITYADRLRGRKILMVSGALDMFGLLDTAIPYSATRETWEAFGKPEWVIAAPGHISMFLTFFPFWKELSHPHHNLHTLFLDGSYADHLLKWHFLPMALE